MFRIMLVIMLLPALAWLAAPAADSGGLPLPPSEREVEREREPEKGPALDEEPLPEPEKEPAPEEKPVEEPLPEPEVVEEPAENGKNARGRTLAWILAVFAAVFFLTMLAIRRNEKK